jgi:crotonobetainyl-CoA:carnitine CoA-transferase CaiB-like acyl-CoA transferase
MLLEEVRRRTTTEWQELFERDHDVWAEVFRRGTELLDHPQMRHDRQVVEIADPERGVVRQPGPLVRLDLTPAVLDRAAPRLDQHGAELRTDPARGSSPADGAGRASESGTASGPPPTAAPLAGLTLLELGVWYAGPHAATLLTDLGARVIKVEPLDGDPLRSSVPFPEAGAAKALQGKESIAVDMSTPEGREIVHELARRSDIVLQAFRAGVAERLGIDAATLRAVNPDLVYLNAPGYGVDGPCGDRPAFGPTIGAGTGLALRNVGATIGLGPSLTLQQVKDDSVRLATVNYSAFASADGLGSLGAATGLLLGLLTRARGAGAQTMLTTMLSTVAHTLSDDMVEYPGRGVVAAPDGELLGFHALYRLYDTAEGWVFLAAPQAKEWQPLGTALAPYQDLRSDPRFACPASRADADAALAGVLTQIFAKRSAAAWEQDLMAAGVGCVAVTEQLPEEYLQSAEFGATSGMLTDVEHPTFGEIPRLAPVVRFSRSAVTPGAGCLLGQHTEAILRELGRSEAEIADLVGRDVVAT